MIIVDYYSRYIEVEILGKRIDAVETIKRLKVIFARFGMPFSITVDNGRQFISEDMKKYCDASNIKLIYTTPYWLQMIGEVERQNRTILKRLKISQAMNKNWQDDLQDFLIMYRSTNTLNHIKNAIRTSIWKKYSRQTTYNFYAYRKQW